MMSAYTEEGKAVSLVPNRKKNLNNVNIILIS
jgi:hypothetical protein